MRLAIVFVASLLSACGRIEETPEVPSPAPSTPPDPSPPAVVTAPTLQGSISFWSFNGALDAHASFPTTLPPPSTSIGPGCSMANDTTREASVEDDANAGDIVIVPPDAAKSLTLSYDAAKRAYEPASTDGWVLGGPPVRVHANGAAGVPAFDTTVAAAADVRFEAPLEGAPLSPEGGDLDVRWSKTEAPLFVVTLFAAGGSVECSFQSSAGHGVIPSALVRQATTLPAGHPCTGTCSATLGISAGDTTRVIAGRYDVFVTHGTQVVRALTLAK